jgi:hypothetical protein
VRPAEDKICTALISMYSNKWSFRETYRLSSLGILHMPFAVARYHQNNLSNNLALVISKGCAVWNIYWRH